MRSLTRRDSGEVIELPEGIGHGWDYMPGDKWERGLVPSALIDEGGGLQSEGRHKVVIDTPSPLADLIKQARPFKSKRLADDLQDHEYVRAFLDPFGADLDQAILWEDVAGNMIPISDQMFRDRSGAYKVGKRGRGQFTPMMAETLMDPDEIWIGVASKPDPVDRSVEELIIDRRYIRVDPKTGLIVVFEIGRKWWEAITAYPPTDKKGRPDLKLLDRRRGGKLVWKRK
ncbi:MAG: PBECR2 nuclease fold domain-containing protein [Pseudoruegeria sp.]